MQSYIQLVYRNNPNILITSTHSYIDTLYFQTNAKQLRSYNGLPFLQYNIIMYLRYNSTKQVSLVCPIRYHNWQMLLLNVS